MNVIVEKRLRALGRRKRSVTRGARRELQAIPDAVRWLLGLER